MEKVICSQCEKPKANLSCGICECTLCKACTQFVEEDRFSFLGTIPQFLRNSTFCEPCFNEKVQPEMDKYDEVMEKAKNIHVFEKKQSKETRLVKRLESPIQILHCNDENETVLRMAFFAVQRNFNSIIDVETKYKKEKNGSYTNLAWSGTCIPAYVDDKKLMKDRTTWKQPN